MCALLFAEDIAATCYQLSTYKVLINHIMKSNNKKQCQSIFSLICYYNNFRSFNQFDSPLWVAVLTCSGDNSSGNGGGDGGGNGGCDDSGSGGSSDDESDDNGSDDCGCRGGNCDRGGDSNSNSDSNGSCGGSGGSNNNSEVALRAATAVGVVATVTVAARTKMTATVT
jgi:hypothetical protein